MVDLAVAEVIVEGFEGEAVDQELPVVGGALGLDVDQFGDQLFVFG